MNQNVRPLSAFHLLVVPLLSNALTSLECPLTRVTILEVKDRKTFASVIPLLPPLPDGLTHLKRIKGNGVVVCPVGDTPPSALDVYGVFSEKEVPACKPVTERQFTFAKERWPCSFHRKKELEEILDGKAWQGDRAVWLEEMVRSVSLNGDCVIVRDGVEVSRGRRGQSPIAHPVFDAVRTLAAREDGAGSYLATGCDVFVRDEPCAMCAMALVHARAHRIFFSTRTANGVLHNDKRWQLHLEPSLNHHYDAFFVDIGQHDRPCCSSL